MTQIPKIKYIKTNHNCHEYSFAYYLYATMMIILYISLRRWQSNRWGEKRAKEYKIMRKPSHFSSSSLEYNQKPAFTKDKYIWLRSVPYYYTYFCSSCDGKDLLNDNNNNHNNWSLPFMITLCLYFSTTVFEYLICARHSINISVQRWAKPGPLLQGVCPSVCGHVLWLETFSEILAYWWPAPGTSHLLSHAVTVIPADPG